MQTTFIAVQCVQCSTMQVKQKTKSSKKWTCVVCNEKQSLRNVFSEGFMAKDVRKFVQNFNMSRQKEEEGGGETVLDFPPCNEENNTKKRRTDWTEYVDFELEESGGKSEAEQGDSELEPIIVTEMPTALFKKPKLKECSVNGSVFPNRKAMQMTEFQQTSSVRASIRSHDEPIELHREERALKWNILRAQIQDNNGSLANKKACPYQSTKSAQGPSVSNWSDYMSQDNVELCVNEPTAAKKLSSKWSSFITEDDDDDDLQIRGGIDSKDQVSQWSSDAFELLMNDQRVEDDIHPDFL
ncbi:hypothetical protein ACJIZ3_003271 [Penstemon smallii]|uniref:MRN complex-interacting protein N-terminal domain-containing protein n=1 Tax=Penstemon smallii TaxID=265156 RepID=A0ABD3UCI7_9LAMI